jgi:hypothetical protein
LCKIKLAREPRHYTSLRFELLLLLSVWANAALASGDSVSVRAPITFGPLTIWTLEAESTVQHPYLSLEAALQSGSAVIHENNSQKLWIENRSDTDLFLQSSDLIKGGQQDRMVENDMIVPAHHTSVDLNVYCIERGRSTKRGAEPIETFSASHWMAPLSHTRLVTQHDLTEQLLTPHVGGFTAPDTNELNLLKSLGSLPQPFGTVNAAQESVWNDVSNVQSELTTILKDSVTRNPSPTSLELTLENNSLADREHATEKKFEHLAEEDHRAVGFVYAINGHIVGAERYGSHALFEAMWPKLLRSIAAETIIEPGTTKESGNVLPSMDDAQQFLAPSTNGKSAREQVNERTLIEASKSDSSYRFETFDSKDAANILHSTWIVK